MYKLTFVICGAIGAVLVSALALFYIKKQSRTKDKLLNVPHEKELSKDYQVNIHPRFRTEYSYKIETEWRVTMSNVLRNAEVEYPGNKLKSLRPPGNVLPVCPGSQTTVHPPVPVHPLGAYIYSCIFFHMIGQ